MTNVEIVDERGRIIMILNEDGEIAVSRFPDLSQEIIETILLIYKDLSLGSVEEMKDFLLYKGEDEFCS